LETLIFLLLTLNIQEEGNKMHRSLNFPADDIVALLKVMVSHSLAGVIISLLLWITFCL